MAEGGGEGEVARAYVGIRPNFAGFRASLGEGVAGPLREVATRMAEVFAIGAGFEFLKHGVEAADTLNEAVERTRNVFGRAAGAVSTFTANSARGLGLSRSQALTAVDAFGVLLTNLGVTRDRAATMSDAMVQAGVNLAAFQKRDPSAVLNAMQRGLAGGTRGLRQFGIVITQADVAQEALARGIVRPTQNLGRLRLMTVQAELAQRKYTQAVQQHGRGSQAAITAGLRLQNVEQALNKVRDGSVPKLTTQQRALATYDLIMDKARRTSGAFHESQNNLAIQERVLGAEWQDIQARIGQAFIPAVVAAIGVIRQVAEWLGPRLTPILAAMGQAWERVSAFIEAHQAGLRGAAIAAALLAVGIVSVSIALGAVAAVVGILASPVTLVLALAAAFGYLYETNARFRAIVQDVGAVAERAFHQALDWINAVGLPTAVAWFQAAIPAVATFATTIASGLVSAWNAVTGAFQAALGVIVGVWNGIVAAVTPPLAAIAALIRAFVSVATGLWNIFGSTITATARVYLAVLEGAFRIAIAAISAVWNAGWNLLSGVVRTVFAIISPIVSGALSAIVSIASGSLAAFATIFRTAFSVITGLVQAFGQILHGDFSGALSTLSNVASTAFNGVVTAVRQFTGGARAAAVAVARGILTGLGNGLIGAINVIAQLTSDVVTGLSGVADAVVGAAEAVGEAIINGVASGMERLAGSLASKAAGIVKGAVSAAAGALHIGSPSRLTAEQLGVPMAQGVAVGFEEAMSRSGTRQISASVSQAVRDAAAQARQALVGLGSALASTIDQALDAAGVRQKAAVDDSAEGRQLAALRAALAAQQAAEDEARLRGAVANATDDQQRKDAQQALDDWLAQRQIDALQASIDAQKAAVDQQTADHKSAVDQQIADLTDALNRGLVTQQQFTAQMNAILAANAPALSQIGTLLGSSVKDTFMDQIHALAEEARVVLSGIFGSGSGVAVTPGAINAIQQEIAAARQQVATDRGSVAQAKGTKDKKDDAAANAALRQSEKHLADLLAALKDLLSVTRSNAPAPPVLIVPGGGAVSAAAYASLS